MHDQLLIMFELIFVVHVSGDFAMLGFFVSAFGRTFTFTFTFSHFADAFIQSDLQLGNT